MLAGNLSESGSEFQRTLPENTRLDLKRSILGIGILSFPECRDWFREKLDIREGGTFPDIILCIRTRHNFVYQNSLVVVKSFFEGKNRWEVIV